MNKFIAIAMLMVVGVFGAQSIEAASPDSGMQVSPSVIILPFFADGRAHADDPEAIIGFDSQRRPMLVAMVAASSSGPVAVTVELGADAVFSYPANVHVVSADRLHNFPGHTGLVKAYRARTGAPLKLGVLVIERESGVWEHVGEDVKMVYLGMWDDPSPYGGFLSHVVFEQQGAGLTLYRESASNGWTSWLTLVDEYSVYEPYDFGYTE